MVNTRVLWLLPISYDALALRSWPTAVPRARTGTHAGGEAGATQQGSAARSAGRRWWCSACAPCSPTASLTLFVRHQAAGGAPGVLLPVSPVALQAVVAPLAWWDSGPFVRPQSGSRLRARHF